MTAAGTLVLFGCVRGFALQGRGTPAPPLPAEHLVVSGLYRHLRNPMYLAVLTVVVGQALLLGATNLRWWPGAAPRSDLPREPG